MDKRKNKSREWRKKLSEANKGQIPWNKGKKGLLPPPWNKGLKGHKIHSKEHKEKLRKNFLGNKLRIGISPWNKGKKGEYKFGPKTTEVKKRISKSLKGHPCYKNKERGKKISIAKKKFYAEHPEAVEAFKKLRSKIKVPKQDSSIEVKVQNFLQQLRIEYFTHQYMKIEHGYLCDILIPSMNLVIECDGDYWHKYPIGNEIDHVRTDELIKEGFKVLRLWEKDIRKMNLQQFKYTIGGKKNV